MFRLLTNLTIRLARYRIGLVWGLLCAVILIGYTVLWYHQAQRIKQFAAQSLATLPSVFPDAKIDASYAGLHIQGFPFSFTLRLVAPRLQYQSDRAQWEWVSDDEMRIAFSLWGRALHVVLPKHSVFIRGLPNAEHRSIAFEYEHAPELTLRAGSHEVGHWWQWWAYRMPEGMENVWRALSAISYDDQGLTLIDEDTKYLLLKTAGNSWQCRATAEKEMNVRYGCTFDTKDLDLDALLAAQGHESLGGMSLSAQGDVVTALQTTPTDIPRAELYLSALTLTTPNFEASLSGEIHIVEEDVFPHGALTLSLSNDREAVSWFARAPAFSEGLLGTALHPQEKDMSGWLQFLHYVSEVVSPASSSENQESDIAAALRIKITRALQGELWIGAHDIEEVITAYRNFIGIPVFKKERNLKPPIKKQPEPTELPLSDF